jgi:NAD(P)H dehydrogenase (quinone)
MNIGIIVHSQSGHTAAAAKAIAEKFRSNGHEVDIKLLLTSGMAKPGSRNFTISNTPEDEEIAAFDAIIVGGPVWRFKASPVIREYLDWLKKIEGKKALAIVTMAFPWKSWGGEKAIHTMNEGLRASGATVLQGEIIRYFFGFNKAKLAEAVERVYKSIAG